MLTVKEYRNILKKFRKNSSKVNVPYLMADVMESPDGCCMSCMLMCCFCCISPCLRDAKVKRSRALQDLFLRTYPGKTMNDLMMILESALDILDRNEMSLDNVRYQRKRLRQIYPRLSSEDAQALEGAFVLLHPEVIVL